MVDKAVGVFMAVVGLAAIAVIFSNRAKTAQVLEALLSGFSKSIRAAVSPVTGK